MKIIILTFGVLILFGHSMAQQPSKKCSCCDVESHQFDFWIGHWDVFDTTGTIVGENKIIALQDGCVIQENWTSKGMTGTSYNYYNKTDSSWHQLWIDNTGNSLTLKGHYAANKMTLKSENIKGKKIEYYYNRITWEKNIDGSVTQIWDIVNNEGAIISCVFNGVYKRRANLVGQGNNRKVTSIGGFFFKSKDPKKLKEWYNKNLGLATNEYGSVFEWRQGRDSSKKGFTQWSLFAATTKYFDPSTKEFMINYRVENLDRLAEQLKKEGVTFTDTIETYSYGKFVHIIDIEGNKIELWEPNDIEYEKIGEGTMK